MAGRREPVGATTVLGRVQEMLGRLPGLGPKSAERVTHYLLNAPRADVIALADALRELKDRLRRCSTCCMPTEDETCPTCLDPRRDPAVVCVVEQPRDQAVVERSGSFRGLYHVLHGRLSPLEGVGADRLTIDHLIERARAGRVREVIMATNPTLEGDGTALYISGLLAPLGVRVTRLARGLPTGSVLEFANSQMLADALEGRGAF
ncbi:MAG: recombination mediator RecR [Planctomycetes bacterium]|jgi:recombination protein RecR|nr:recombination mediator RecR [Planctomycetota bacterium]